MELTWDAPEDRRYETGVDHGVLYIPDPVTGLYTNGVAWNGLTTITESPSGAESQKTYADNMVYLNLTSAEDFAATLEALTYPPEFEAFDGAASPVPGVTLGQQSRGFFGLSYRTKVGTALDPDAGYKIHLVYGAKAAPSEKARATVNETPEAMALSWELSTTPVAVGVVGGKEYKPTAHLTVDSTLVDPDDLATLEGLLYGADGTPGSNPSLPLPAAVIAMFPVTP